MADGHKVIEPKGQRHRLDRRHRRGRARFGWRPSAAAMIWPTPRASSRGSLTSVWTATNRDTPDREHDQRGNDTGDDPAIPFTTSPGRGRGGRDGRALTGYLQRRPDADIATAAAHADHVGAGRRRARHGVGPSLDR